MANQEALMKLKEAYGGDYARFCEESGDYEEALKYYSQGSRESILHAAEICLRISDYARAKEFIKRVKIIIKKEEDSANSQPIRPDCRSDWQRNEQAKTEREKFRKRISELEGSLIDAGQL